MTFLTSKPMSRARLKPVAIPAEHGGWGFLLEPLLLGLLVAPSWGGIWLAVSTVGVFLMRPPLKIALTDRRRRRYERTLLAERFVLLYGSMAVLGLGAAVLAAGADILLPLVIAAPAGMIQVIYDVRSDSRHWLPEVAGPAALGSAATGIALAGGWPTTAAFALWPIILARAIPSVLYVRAYLRLAKGGSPSLSLPLLAQATGIGAVLALTLAGLTPVLAVVALVILLLRAIIRLSGFRRPTAPRVIGFQEIGFGIMTVVLTAAGYAAGI